MPKELPYFRWFPADASTDEVYLGFTLEELGLFHKCLNQSWLNHGLPNDMAMLARLMNTSQKTFNRLWKEVGRAWYEHEGRLLNRRQEEERERAIAKSEGSSNGSARRRDLQKPGYIYLVSRPSDGAVKIGSALNVPRRLAQLKHRYSDHSLTLIRSFEVQSMGDCESSLQDRYVEKRITGEWFALTPRDVSDIAITLWGDTGGDTQGDEVYHPNSRAYESVSVLTKPDLQTEREKPRIPSLKFAEWWSAWSSVRGTNHRFAAENAYFQWVTEDLEEACLECTQSYLASLENPGKGYNPENFLADQSRDRFAARWPRRMAAVVRLSPSAAAFAELERRVASGEVS